ncbi:MAG TPA: PocR ligand-binding domain-containing protein [Candidatus Sulfotelmatobacter sp.]|nr:PocR ligand-binding domain-containing protein [Candidatus Sulfotelmatobacter sp.]
MSRPTQPATAPAPDRSHLVDGKYSIEDLVDIEQLRRLFEQFSKATGFTTGFVSYPEQKILIATGWRDICTKFHRACPLSAQTCRKSNISLTARLAKLQTLNIEPCGHGLADGATPVIVRGKHLASLSTGQVLLEPPNLERFKAQAQKYGYDAEKYLAALSQVPVVSADRLRSVLTFLSGIATFIAEQALTNLQLGQTTQALQQQVTCRKRLEQELLQVSEREQRRIALDLHDGLCQRLVATGFTAEALYRDLSARSQGEAKTAKLIGDLLDSIITDARRLSRGLHPVMAESNGLMSALSELADMVSHLCRIHCRFQCPKLILLRDNAVATHLFRIAQEAVNNAVKHSKATHLVIALRRDRRGLVLQVRDNGVGLPVSLPARTGLGLQIMHYRGDMIGAVVQVRRGTRAGSIVTCTLPKHRPRSKRQATQAS